MRRTIGRLLSAASFALVLTAGVGSPSTVGAATSPSQISFANTGAPQTWVVPSGITKIATKVCGASGEFSASGHNLFAGRPGYGGCVSAVLAVTPGETLIVRVGGVNDLHVENAYNGGGASPCVDDMLCGGGGGGASDVRQGGDALSNRVLVGGGGGGGGGSTDPLGGRGGSGGNGRNGFSGDAGGLGNGYPDQLIRADGGPGGTLTGPGKSGCGVIYTAHGPVRNCPILAVYAYNISGKPGKGANGGDASFDSYAVGGGGGGGYFGGAAGAGAAEKNTTGTTGGGGGSSYASPAVTSQVRLSEQKDTQWMKDYVAGVDLPSRGEPGRVTFSWPVPASPAVPKPEVPSISSVTVDPSGSGAVTATFNLGPIFDTAVAPGQTPVQIVTSLEYATGPNGPWLALSFPVPADKKADVTGSFSLNHLTDGKPILEGSTLLLYLRDSGPGGQSSGRPAKVTIPLNQGFKNPSATTTTLSTTPTTQPASTTCPVTYPSIHVGLGAPVNVSPTGVASADRFGLAGGVLPGGLSLLANGQVSGRANVPTNGVTSVKVLRNGVACTFVSIDVAPPSALHYPPSVTVRPGSSISVAPTPVSGATYFLLSGPPGVQISPSTGVLSWSVPASTKGNTSVVVGRTIGTSTATSVIAVIATVNAPSFTAPSGTTTTTIPKSPLPSVDQSGSCIASPKLVYPEVITSSGSTVTVAPNLSGIGTPTSFTVTAGALPQGLALDGAVGVISGTPSYLPGSSTVATIAISFTNHTVRLATFHLLALASPLRLNYPNHVAAAVGYDTLINPSIEGLSSGTRFAIACGTLPPGLELDSSTGQVVGQPTEAVNAPAPVIIRAIDPRHGAVDASLIVTVGEPTPTVALPTVAYGTSGKALKVRPTLGDLDPSSMFSVVGGTLPDGLALNKHNGTLSGTPTTTTEGQSITIAAVQPGGQPTVAATVSLVIGQGGSSPSSSFPWLLIAILAILVLVAVAVLAARRSKKV